MKMATPQPTRNSRPDSETENLNRGAVRWRYNRSAISLSTAMGNSGMQRPKRSVHASETKRSFQSRASMSIVHRRFQPQSIMLTLGSILSIIVVIGSSAARAFVMPSSGYIAPKRHAFASEIVQSSLPTRHATSMFFRDEDSIDEMRLERSPNNKEIAKKKSDFQSRMMRIVVQQKSPMRQRRNSNLYRPQNVKTVKSLEDFAGIIKEARNDEKVVVVRFYATWCKTCHSLRPVFDKAAASNPQVIFVDVPVLETNSNLHQGLGVESVPFGHIYHPKKGLVAEEKLSRKTFHEFEGLVKMHSSND